MSDNPVLSVSELTRKVKELIETQLGHVWVVGEISNCTQAGSGHVYLTLKDDQAQLRAVIWRRTASRLKFDLHDGLEVVAAGPLEVYQARGSYQLIVEQLIPKGSVPWNWRFASCSNDFWPKDYSTPSGSVRCPGFLDELRSSPAPPVPPFATCCK